MEAAGTRSGGQGAGCRVLVADDPAEVVLSFGRLPAPSHASNTRNRDIPRAQCIALMLHRSIIIRARTSICGPSKPDISPDWRWRIPMKTMFLAAVAALSLGVGSAYAQGVPAGYQEPHYGAAAFTNHTNEAQTQFLGPNTVLGKMFRYHSESNHQVAVAATSAKGG
jgi:hypothetical protein